MKVRVEIDPQALDNECHNNCIEKVKRDGGAVVVGWRISWATTLGKYLVTRDHHAVWESPGKELIDISPRVVRTSAGVVRVTGETEIEFESDPSAAFVGGKTLPSVYVTDGPDPHGLLAKACERANAASKKRAAGDTTGAEYDDQRSKTFLEQHHKRLK